MKVAFRADASLQIGSGHIMRCLTLASKISEKGGHCLFICRPHEGNLISYIISKGFHVCALSENIPLEGEDKTGHLAWLGCDWQKDAEETKQILLNFEPDWLVVDHYALDFQWESIQRLANCKIMVLDDLVDRRHCCDILLDQTLGRRQHEYHGLVPTDTNILSGTKYALLRPEFYKMREQSLIRRSGIKKMSKVLITMGGVDQSNATRLVLDALNQMDETNAIKVTVVLGGLSSNLDSIQDFKQYSKFEISILSNVSNMAELMAEHDLAIGAAGSTSWERCCVGLPTAIVILADNQAHGARMLVSEGAASVIGGVDEIQHKTSQIIKQLSEPNFLRQMSDISSTLVDGRGVDRVCSIMGGGRDAI